MTSPLLKLTVISKTIGRTLDEDLLQLFIDLNSYVTPSRFLLPTLIPFTQLFTKVDLLIPKCFV